MKIQIGNETLETREVKGLLQKRNPTELEIEIVEGALVLASPIPGKGEVDAEAKHE
jgi:hypothetical protein